MTDEAERRAMCAEIARMVGFNRGAPAGTWITIKEYATSIGVSETSARRHFAKLMQRGKMISAHAVVDNHPCVLYQYQQEGE